MLSIEEAERSLNESVCTKIKWLKEKWNSKRYQKMIEEVSLMHAILFMQTKPIHVAVVVDDLISFKAHYTQTPEDIELFLMEACLCGSKNIANFLLEQNKSTYKERPDLLGYIAGSMNIEWAKDVAFQLAQAKLSLPEEVHRLAEGETARAIAEIFNNTNAFPLTPYRDAQSLTTLQQQHEISITPKFKPLF